MKFTRKHGRRGRVAILAVFLVAVLMMYLYVQQYQFMVSPELSSTQLSVQASPVHMNWSNEGLSAVGAMDYGLLADSGNKDKVVPIASIAKLFTALAVLEKKPLGDDHNGELITITAADEAFFHSYMSRGGSVMPVTAGQQLSQYQLLQALLIPSANNTADTLVTWSFGSMDAYVAYANDMVKRMGLEQTVIADASGFSPATVSSPKDLIALGEIAMKQPIIAEIMRQPTAQVQGHALQSTNKLLGQQGIIGGKTGNTDQAGDCLLFIADYVPTTENKVTIIGVVLGQGNRQATFARTQSLLASAQAGFGTIKIVEAGAVIGHYATPWQTKVNIVPKQDLAVFGWRGTQLTPNIKVDRVAAGLAAGQTVGFLTVKAPAKTYQTPLNLQEPLTKPSMVWRFTHILSLSAD